MAKAAKKVEDDDIKEEETPDFEVKIDGDEKDENTAPGKAAAETGEVGSKPVSEEETGAYSLRKQIDELKKAQEVAQQKAQEAERHAQLMAQQLTSYQQTAAKSQLDSIETALGAAQMEIDSAKRDIVLSGQAQDYMALADAHERLAAAKAHIISLEHAKNNRPQQSQPSINDNIDAAQDLSWEEKSWLKSHPEALTDMRKNARLNAAYYDALDKGFKRGSPDYFNFIEEELGYKQRHEPMKQPRDEEDTIVVAAPVTRSSPSGTGTGGKKSYTLTKEEAEIAKLSGITPAEYVKQRETLRELKKVNPGDYPER